MFIAHCDQDEGDPHLSADCHQQQVSRVSNHAAVLKNLDWDVHPFPACVFVCVCGVWTCKCVKNHQHKKCSHDCL